MTDALIYGGVRTPRGKTRPSGALHSIRPSRLAEYALRVLLAEHGATDGIDDILLDG